jgi:hypothetical protein
MLLLILGIAKHMETKNEHIALRVIDQDRHKIGEKMQEELARRTKMNADEKKYHYHSCEKPFGEPKLVQYYGCPHCHSKAKAPKKKKGIVRG